MKENFGQTLKELRIRKGLTLRNACRVLNYDPSNWSKIERGKISPPSNEKTLRKWAKTLGLSDEKEIHEFIDKANLVQGMISRDILSKENAVDFLPAFFRTLRNKKPTRKEINQLIRLIQKI
ncbi:MAG: helix-turn-helix domain-containing protein [Candidatus Nealsonbacteria bacterium]|nr:helix-turn-helix domain-containing protein [Candidatus Nealsonbacteria bacterium]